MNSESIEKCKKISFEQIESNHGQKCSFIDLENASLNLDPKHNGLVKQIRDLQKIRNDLRFVNDLVGILKSSVVNITVANGLWFSAIVTYAKCFNSAEHKTRLDKKQYFKGESKEKRRIHENMIDIRNGYIAHDSSDDHSGTKVFLTVSKDSTNKELLKVDGMSYALRRPSLDELDTYESVVVMVHNKVDTNILKKERILYDDLKNFKSVDEWYRYITD